MIITRLSGGLGNQMFQYAMGRSLALRNSSDLRIDISSFSSLDPDTEPRQYRLKFFNIYDHIATDEDYSKMGIPPIKDFGVLAKINRKLFRLKEFLKPVAEKKVIIEKNYTFDEEVYNAGSDCLLLGIWQSEKYFKAVEETIRNDFSLRYPLSEKNQSLLKIIESKNSVSLHVRRGDYLSNPKTSGKHGVLSLDYYNRAVSQIVSQNPDAEFFIFSDDIEWAKNNLKISSPTSYISGAGIEDYEELFLMSKCKHNILANSSFSWWGAWLNQNDKKMIIAPKNWFNKNIDTQDLLPNNWTQI